MATLKHINSKNADYGAAEQYLLFEHDEFTMKPVLDETGRLIPREDYRLSCPLTGSWPQPSCAGEAGNGVPSAGRPLSPNPTGENTAPTAPGA